MTAAMMRRATRPAKKAPKAAPRTELCVVGNEVSVGLLGDTDEGTLEDRSVIEDEGGGRMFVMFSVDVDGNCAWKRLNV